MRAISFFPVCARSNVSPSKVMAPPSAVSRKFRQRSSVVLPDPLGPRIATTSPRPSIQREFFTECSVVWVGQRQNPSWCLAVSITIPKPASRSVSTHWSVSISVGANTSGDSLPSPHSLSVNVLTVKWMNAVSSHCCQASCSGVGTSRAAMESFSSGVASPNATCFS